MSARVSALFLIASLLGLGATIIGAFNAPTASAQGTLNNDSVKGYWEITGADGHPIAALHFRGLNYGNPGMFYEAGDPLVRRYDIQGNTMIVDQGIVVDMQIALSPDGRTLTIDPGGEPTTWVRSTEERFALVVAAVAAGQTPPAAIEAPNPEDREFNLVGVYIGMTVGVSSDALRGRGVLIDTSFLTPQLPRRCSPRGDQRQNCFFQQGYYLPNDERDYVLTFVESTVLHVPVVAGVFVRYGSTLYGRQMVDQEHVLRLVVEEFGANYVSVTDRGLPCFRWESRDGDTVLACKEVPGSIAGSVTVFMTNPTFAREANDAYNATRTDILRPGGL